MIRDDDRRWIKSFCDKTGRFTRLWKIKETTDA